MNRNGYQVLVVGGGHAGIEAAAAAARIGAKTALVTLRKDRIGEMSCNPAVGGLAKGQIVREVDALGGLMGQVADMAGIQFRVLNASKGPAVRAPRAQQDKSLYRRIMSRVLGNVPDLDIIEAEVQNVVFEGEEVAGVIADGEFLAAGNVVITGGTFLNGLIFCGEKRIRAGRMGERASCGLSDYLMELGLKMGRMKTGTPPRIQRESIDFGKFGPQYGDEPPTPFSFMTGEIATDQVLCYIGFTNQSVHRVIMDNMDRSPLYSGQIVGIGPRYCPSIEDKVVKFPRKERHQIFLEPEIRGGESIYVNGVSTSLPEEVQQEFVRMIPGMEKAKFLRPGYAVEYDFMQPTQLKATLEMKDFNGLFCCGQINGTSGYEEAAGQGIVAGANAALRALKRSPLVLDRADSYIGVMIDDLITHGADEPYRMFTSRAENRLSLRADNADRRLTEQGFAHGLISEERWEHYQRKLERLEKARGALKAFSISSNGRDNGKGLALRGGLKKSINGLQLLRRPEISINELVERIPRLGELSQEELISIETDEKYAGYINRQKQYSSRVASQKHRRIPLDLRYDEIPGLSREMVDRLSRVRPETLGQAAQIPGITPAAVAALAIQLTRYAQIE